MLRRSVENWCFHAEDLMQFRRRCRVLHVDLLLREDIGRRAKGCQRSFVEARQDQLFLAWVGVDVAHREDARNVGFELFGVDHFQLLALDIQTPFGDRAQFWRQTEKHQQHVKRQAASNAVGTGDLDLGQFAVLGFKPVACPTRNCISYCSHSSFILATDAGAARNSSRRCSSTTDSALPTKFSAQSSAESPPPQMTMFLPSNCAGSLTR